ncbi:MAG: pitrilysin family protein [Chloroflexota bacterium]
MSPKHSLPGADDITRVSLPNGITVLVRTNPSSPSASLSGFLHAGSLFDSDEKLGRSTFATAALMRGTQSMSFEQIYNELESVGAGLGFSSGAHTTGFSGRALVEDLPLLFTLLSAALRTPTFPNAEVERLRNQILTGLAMRAQDTGDMAAMAFDRIIFGDHPYARPEEGYPETVKALTRDDLLDYHQHCFGPRGMTIAVVGAVDPAQVTDLINQSLGDWQVEQEITPTLPEAKALKQTVREHIALQGKSQTDLLVGVLGPVRNAPEYLATSLGNSVLGQFGMMGRIGDIVREQSGLAYYASSNVSAGTGPGTWEVSAGVNPANLEKALDLIISELKLFTEEGVSPEELRDSQDHYVGRLPLSMESNAGVANSLINIERHNLGLDYYRNYEDQVRAVTPEMVLDAARKYINPAALAITTSGP